VTSTAKERPADSDLRLRFVRLRRKGEMIHHFAENLAQTLGVFHGLNETGKKLKLEGESIPAIQTLLFDQLQIMVIRLCALCADGKREDDASLGGIVAALRDAPLKQFLIERERKWRANVGWRAGDALIVKNLTVMNTRWSVLQSETEALGRITHFRNKALAHATTGLDPERKVIISDVWRLSRLALSVAKYVRLVLEREDWNYLEHSRDGKANGKALVMVLHRAARQTVS
jgi:hypothetical protein